MDMPSVFRGAGSVLALGILAVLIGVLVPQEWAIAQLFRGVGVIVTFMGMIGMVAERQSARDTDRLPHITDPQN